MSAGNVFPAVLMIDAAEVGLWSDVVLAEGFDTASQGKDRTCVSVTTATVCDSFVAIAVFLLVKGDGAMGDAVKIA